MLVIYTQSESQVQGAIKLLEKLENEKPSNTVVYDTSGKFEKNYAGKYLILTKKNALLILLKACLVNHKLILGDDRRLHLFFRILFLLANEIYFVDDGLLSFWIFERYFLKKKSKNHFLFTKYKEQIERFFQVKHPHIKKQDYRLQADQNFKEKHTLILGGAYISIGFLTLPRYTEILNYLANYFNATRVVFVPHPRDAEIFQNIKDCQNLKFEIRTPDENFDTYVSKYLVEGANVVSFFSSALVDCSILQKQAKFFFMKLPGYSDRASSFGLNRDPHLYGFNVEMRIYEIFETLGFTEIKYNE